MQKKDNTSDLAVLAMLLIFLLIGSLSLHWYVVAVGTALLLGGIAILLFRKLGQNQQRSAWILDQLSLHGGKMHKKELLTVYGAQFKQDDPSTFELTLTSLAMFQKIRPLGDWISLLNSSAEGTEAPTFAISADIQTEPVAHSADRKNGWTPEPELLGPKPRKVSNFTTVISVGVLVIAGICFSKLMPGKVAVAIGSFFAVIIIFIIRSSRDERRIVAIGDAVAGRVEEIQRNGRQVSVTFSYKYEGNSMTGAGVVGLEPAIVVGDVMTLLVDPNNPSDIVVYRSCEFRVKP